MYYFLSQIKVKNFERDKLETNAHWSFVPLPNSMSTFACPPLDGMVEKKNPHIVKLYVNERVLQACLAFTYSYTLVHP